MILTYNKVHDSNERPLLQSDGVKVILPDQSEIYANVAYLNKLFKDSGYKGYRTVNNVYEIVGDTNKMDNLHIEGHVIVENDDCNFIYLSESSYKAITEILGTIDDKYRVVRVLGDISDFTKFEVVFVNQDQEYVLEVNLVKEWAYLYTSRRVTDGVAHILEPFVISSCDLFEENSARSILDSIVPSYEADEFVSPHKELYINDLCKLLTSTGIVKFDGRKKKYVSCTESDTVISKVTEYLEKINGCRQRFIYTTKSGYTYREVVEEISRWYREVIDLFNDDLPFKVSSTLWTIAKFGKYVMED